MAKLIFGVETTERSTDYIQIAKNVFESYPQSLSHGLQKDTIQNNWDACVNKTKHHVTNNWGVEFELIKNPKGEFLVMTDYGTTGLTGKLTTKDISEDSLPAETERWARWESFAFPNPNDLGLGARGQGKMIPIFSSKDFTIVYDSLRADGSYRAGFTKASHTGCPVWHGDETVGKKKLKEITGLEPIQQQGTRVIIYKPKPEIVKAIKEGELLKSIEETWWPIILKFGAKIQIKYDSNTLQANVPEIFFPIPNESAETKTFKIWKKEIEKIKKIKYEGEYYAIKRIYFACDIDKEVDELHRGIAVFRGGMKVETVDFPEKSFRNRVYGYVEFEEDTEKILRKIETPNHYSFKNIGLWKKIKDYIEEELQQFGNKKLGLGISISEKEKTKRNSAENKALSVLSQITKDWPFAKNSKGPNPPPPQPPEPPNIKDVGITAHNIVFSDDIPRLNYGDSLEDFYSTVFNKTTKTKNLLYDVTVFSGGTSIIQLDSKKIQLHSDESINSKKYSFKVTKKDFQSAGEYRINFRINDADDKNKERIDHISRRFWVDTEPPLKKGPFEVKGKNFSELPKLNQKREWFLYNEGDNKHTLYYNLEHNAYEYQSNSEDTLTLYLSETFCLGALQLLISQVKSNEIDEEKKEKLPFNYEIVIEGDPIEIYKEYTTAISIIRGEINK